jgi:preprotein translocase subunit YajC
MDQVAQFIPLILIGGLMYAVLILPQQRRNKEHRTLLAGLEEGDEVVLNSGIHGFISDIAGDIVWLEVADKVELKVSRSAIAAKVQAPAETEGD